MASFKSLITHGYIRTSTRDQSLKEGVFATIDLHIGPGDDKGFYGIVYKKVGKEFVFTCESNYGKSICEDLVQLSALYMENIRKIGRFEYNKTYRVNSNSAVEITDVSNQ